MDIGGGAATACLRLLSTMQQQGHNCSYLVAEKILKKKFVFSAYNNPSVYKLKIALERYFLKFKESSIKHRFQFSIPKWGANLSQHKAIQQADIIHIHWPHRSFINLKELEKIGALGKPIVWTLHDMWAMTGGCHYTADCLNYLKQCGHCYMLKKPGKSDLSNQWWNKKKATFNKVDIQFVTCSQWLCNEALQSGLLANQKVKAIPNPINVDLFKPIEKQEALNTFSLKHDKKYLLFLAASADDNRKGFKYLKKALIDIETKNYLKNLELLIVGNASTSLFDDISTPIHYLGHISDWQKIIKAYNAADVFIIPSLQDNLPNSIMEALACGTPVVGFNTGGIPEMVEHKKTGYIAEYKNTTDLAKGINWVLQNPEYDVLCKNARQKVLNHYSMPVIAQKFEALYQALLA